MLTGAELASVIVPIVTAETVESLPQPLSPVAHLSAVPPLAPVVDPAAARAVRSLVLLGDSGPFGIGDPVPGGGWRGFGPLLREALGEPRYVNMSVLGARAACVRAHQLPDALRDAPDVAVLMVGMNDTLRSDFDAGRLRDDLDAVVGPLRAAGCTVLTVRFHDHSRVFDLPGPLRRALHRRITDLNGVIDDLRPVPARLTPQAARPPAAGPAAPMTSS